MGNTCHTWDSIPIDHHTNRSLVVVTLNYGGILKSPFQFYSNEQQQQQKLSEIFCKLIPIYVTKFNEKQFDWDIGKIDHKIQGQRLAPIYRADAGLNIKNKSFLSAKEFQKQWDSKYDTATKNIKIEPSPTKQNKNNMKMFDLICYHAILQYLYKVGINKKLQSLDLSKLDITAYKKYMNKRFGFSFLDEQRKIQKLKFSLIKSKADVIFMQQPTKLLIQTLKEDKNITVKQRGPGLPLIIIRNKTFWNSNHQINFGKLEYPESQQKFFTLSGNKNVTVEVVNDNILISAHLSSNKTKNQPQIVALKSVLNTLRQKFKGYQIILGMDANNFVDKQNLNQDFYSFPYMSLQTTTRKKRTCMQVQFPKANKVIQQCKDHIFSTLKIKHKGTFTIDNKKCKGQQLLPTDKHPFDHFMVVCEVKSH